MTRGIPSARAVRPMVSRQLALVLAPLSVILCLLGLVAATSFAATPFRVGAATTGPGPDHATASKTADTVVGAGVRRDADRASTGRSAAASAGEDSAALARIVAAETVPKAITAGERVAPWAGTSLSRVTQTEETMYRVWGGDSGQAGEWLTPIEPTSAAAARHGLALPGGNTAEYVSRVTVPAGTRIQVGTAGGAFGEPGGWTQVQLLQRIPSANFGKGVPLGP